MDIDTLLSKVDDTFYNCIGTTNTDSTPVIALVSGGLDSCVMLKYLSLKNVKIIAITINPRSRSSMEIMALRRIVSMLNIDKLIVINMPELYESIELKDLGYELYRDRDKFYIPGRNALFLSMGIYIAEIYNANIMFTAHNKDDSRFFPDSSAEFMNMISSIGEIYLGRKSFKACPLFKELSKLEVAALGKIINAPMEESWSCYMGYPYQCGKCRGCIDRTKALDFAHRFIAKKHF